MSKYMGGCMQVLYNPWTVLQNVLHFYGFQYPPEGLEAISYQEQEVAILSFTDFPVSYQKKTKLP